MLLKCVKDMPHQSYASSQQQSLSFLKIYNQYKSLKIIQHTLICKKTNIYNDGHMNFYLYIALEVLEQRGSNGTINYK